MFVLNTVAEQRYGRCSERTKERYNKMTETFVSVIFSLDIRKSSHRSWFISLFSLSGFCSLCICDGSLNLPPIGGKSHKWGLKTAYPRPAVTSFSSGRRRKNPYVCAPLRGFLHAEIQHLIRQEPGIFRHLPPSPTGEGHFISQASIWYRGRWCASHRGVPDNIP